MARETIPVLGVSQDFGQRFTGGAVGSVKTEGARNEIALNLTGEVLTTRILSPLAIPAGSVITRAYLRVTQPFVTAASTAVRVGTKGSEATNGVTLTKAQLEAAGFYDVTASLSGTYAVNTPLAANSTLGVAFTAGSVTDRNAGRAVLVIETTRVVA